MTCRIVAALFVLLWIIGVATHFAAAAGMGDWADVIASLVMTPLGLPWNLSALMMGDAYGARLVVALAAPAINLLIVYGLCRLIARRLCPEC